MIVTAHSDAGSTDSELKFATLTYTGSTIKPLHVVHKPQVEFYQKVQVMVPLCGIIVVSMVVLVAVFFFVRRRKERLRYKETSSNLRRDITAETSLMNDLDKRLNTDLDSSSSTLPDQFSKRNVNLLISLPSDDNLHANAQVPIFIADTSKTGSENGTARGRTSYQITETKDESNINPYATFNEVKLQQQAKQPEIRKKKPPQDFVDHLNKSSEDDDDIALQKAAAREVLLDTPSESYVPFFSSKEVTHKQPRPEKPRYKKHPPPLPAPRKTTKTEALINRDRGIILSPRRYASADHIHALFTQPARPQSSHKSAGSGSSEKSQSQASHRNSLLSSVTTVSSSRDELLEALENAKRHPPPPVLYESQPESSSQPTDSSVATEPGIRQFTQSPPRPNEQREASCEVPPYERELDFLTEKRRPRPRRVELSSDTTECEGGELKERSPPRRVRGRHRGKQRGHVTNKRQLGTTFVPRRANSRTSTTSSEEVTYSFGGGGGGGGGEKGSPGRSYSPAYASSHRPPAYPAAGYAYGSPMIVPIARRGGRLTPHGKLPPEQQHHSMQQSDREDNPPLLMKGGPGVLASPAEEEERISLLDRHYRPVPEEDSELEALSAGDGGMDKGYTDDFTIV
ncbi:uncharacterized protein [Littorina saxatilis]|uniref:uncharacterized protein n=1 Tax=Littorina saxatilis TaxID=31220 RepID=UPI0038B57227